MLRESCAFACAFALLWGVQPALAGSAQPSKIGECTLTRISQIGHRLEDGRTHVQMTTSGSAVSFANRLYQVSYDEMPEVGHSQVGDPVLICLVSIPQHCPRGDDRGKIYTTTNLRTVESWTLPDSEHSCGGA